MSSGSHLRFIRNSKGGALTGDLPFPKRYLEKVTNDLDESFITK